MTEMMMQTNQTPFYDSSDNPTNCCPRFKSEAWDNQTMHFENKRFVRAKTKSLMHIPINMGSVFTRTFNAMQDAGAVDIDQTLVMSRDLSPWSAEHLFAVSGPVPGQKMVSLSGDYKTKVLNAGYRDAHKLGEEFEDNLEAEGLDVEEQYVFYTTCPKCAKTYGENYMVAIARVEPDDDD
jgi:hypothetical protein